MRLVFGEIQKIFSNRLVIIFLVALFVCNGVVLFGVQMNDESTSIIAKNRQKYDGFISECVEVDLDTAKSNLEYKKTVYNIANRLTSSAADSEQLEVLKKEIQTYKENYPQEYAEALKISSTDEDVLIAQTLIRDISGQLEYIENYDDFLNNMQKRADNQKKFSVFSEEGSFSYNNIEKTPADFENLKGIKLQVGNNTAVKNLTEYNFTDFILIIILLLICFYLFSLEKEKGLLLLVRTTQGGRTKVMLTKILVLSGITVIISTVFYGSNIIICGIYSGLGDMSRNIQSIDLFMHCPFALSILQYIILWVLIKIVTLVALSCIFVLIFTFINNTAFAYATIFAFLGLEYILYTFVGENATFNHFKYINIFNFISANNFVGSYINLNFFTHPVNLVGIYIFVFSFIIVISVTVSCLIYTKSSPVKKSTGIFKSFSGKIGIIRKNSGSVSVINGEMFKHYISSKAILAITILLFVAYFNVSRDISLSYENSIDKAYSVYMSVLEGENNMDKEKYIVKQQKYFDDLDAEYQSVMMSDSVSDDEKQLFEQSYMSIKQVKGVAFEQIIQQKSYADATAEKLNITPYYINTHEAKKLIEDSQREWIYFVFVLIVIIFSCSDIFACEYRKGMINIVRSSKKGRINTLLAKSFVSLLTLGIAYTLIYLPYMMNFVNTFGDEILSVPVIFFEDFSSISSGITFGKMIMLEGVIHTAFFLLTDLLVMYMSNRLKNYVLTLTVSTAVTLLPCLIVINQGSIRLFSVFKSEMWHIVITTIIFAELIVIILYFLTLVKHYLNFKR